MKGEEKIEYPLRINRYLALKGFSTRRGADELILQGRVKINGCLAKLGDKINISDKVELVSKKPIDYIYLAYNKPRGIVTHTPQPGERSIKDVLKIGKDLFPLGRLDKDSHGLIILTNDGRITDRLLNPEYIHEKEYAVEVDKPIKRELVRRIEKGVNIEGYRTRPGIFSPTGERSFRLVITEGKKHQIRRMCTALGYQVIDLKRIRIMNIGLKGLKAGEHREIKGKELEVFSKNLGL